MKKIIRMLAIVAIVLVVTLLSLPFLISVDRFRPVLESELTKALGREVKIGALRLAVLSGGVAADDLSVADDPSFSAEPFLLAKSLRVGVDLWPLIVSRKLNVRALTIDQPRIALVESASGKWNFSGLGAKPSAKSGTGGPAKAGLDLSVRLVKIMDGRLSLRKAHGGAKPLVLDKVNVELRDVAAGSAFPFSLSAKPSGGGEIKLQGTAGPLNVAGAATPPLEAVLTVTHLDLATSGLVEAATGITGVVSIDGKAKSDGRAARIDGHIKTEKLTLSKGGSPAGRPVEFDFGVAHDFAKRSGALHRGIFRAGKAEASLTGAYSLQGASPAVNLKLSGSNMPVPELVALLPALNVVLPKGSSIEGGTAAVSMDMQGPVDHMATSGSVGIEKTRLAGFDLGSKMAAVQALAGIKSGPNTEIQILSANVKTSPAGTNVDDIRLVAPAAGELTGAGSIGPGHALDFKMRVTLRTSSGVMAILGQKGDASIPFLVQGTASNPSFKPDLKAVVSEKSKAATGLLDRLLGGKKQK